MSSDRDPPNPPDPDRPVLIVRRAFVRVDGREVHLRVVGAGPPALFIHSSPTNSGFVLTDMLAQAHRYTCIAFDTPGFGLSDPLPGATLSVADLATATIAAMDALGLPPLPIFGTHSGAAIALELGYLYPDRVTGLVLDAVPISTAEELAPFHANGYFAPLTIDRLGGHFASTWTRFRDQSRWYPWTDPSPQALNPHDLATPELTHRWTEMFYAAADGYAPAYRAAACYGGGAIVAAANLAVPAVFMALTGDMLHSHLTRLPPLGVDQSVVDAGSDAARKQELTGEAFLRFGSAGVAPRFDLLVESSTTIQRHVVMDGGRAQFVRTLGDRANPALIVLHDVPGAGIMVEPAMTALAGAFFVIAPDLPGSGESDPLTEDAPLSHYAQALARICAALGVEQMTVRALGFSASLAVQMAADFPGLCTSLEIDGLFAPDADERAALCAHYAPPIMIERDGAHWYRLWLMLRDTLVYWPWYDTRQRALLRVEGDFGAARLHDWTVAVMQQHGSYHRLIQAILAQDATAVLKNVGCHVTVLAPQSPVGHAYAGRIAAVAP